MSRSVTLKLIVCKALSAVVVDGFVFCDGCNGCVVINDEKEGENKEHRLESWREFVGKDLESNP